METEKSGLGINLARCAKVDIRYDTDVASDSQRRALPRSLDDLVLMSVADWFSSSTKTAAFESRQKRTVTLHDTGSGWILRAVGTLRRSVRRVKSGDSPALNVPN